MRRGWDDGRAGWERREGRGEGVRGARGVGGLVACERARACALCVGVGLCVCANARAHVHVSMCVRKQRMQGQRGGREGKGRGEHLESKP